ncbi:hypothetical protein ADL22_28100 [Streptomyces sp. NRRL F-4489]|uniref:effector-associated constant component EACC1 n=1 Tax=Streptomyces sp. NRRL F-4489 TaxID=1609095 RepID=UPI0007492B42|nr:hypothetical protein [Streptomyces sp. NRRL F-4489]KUL35182.1 hypothetical protein ADL22_28100 [Streptomyces sp. NRRL F-4489]
MTDLDVRAETGPGGDAEAELRSLLRWLQDDEELRRQVRGTLGAGRAPRPGEMGLGFDLLQLAVGTAVSAGSLAVSILQWRDTRRRAPGLTLRSGGVEVRVERGAAGDEETVRRIIALLDGAAGLADGGGTGAADGAGTGEPGGDGPTP